MEKPIQISLLKHKVLTLLHEMLEAKESALDKGIVLEFIQVIHRFFSSTE